MLDEKLPVAHDEHDREGNVDPAKGREDGDRGGLVGLVHERQRELDCEQPEQCGCAKEVEA